MHEIVSKFTGENLARSGGTKMFQCSRPQIAVNPVTAYVAKKPKPKQPNDDKKIYQNNILVVL